MENISVFRAEPGLIVEPEMWAFIKKGLDTVRKRIGDRAKWTPMHVRQAVVSGGSELWLLVSGTDPLGFYILSAVNDPFIGVPTSLFVWIAYGEKPGLIELGLPYVKERARELGLETIEMMSPRHGWMRRLERHGFEVKDVIYGLKV